ncbi:manganese efflux pump MntP family protein [Ruminococcus sp.]|uniref:manganese efflux pump MntP n=1 Tax=Ruminococcus sp. TaxID=41978 RepID=UPI0025EF9D88|nr:manganese efflux pump MntP family protein [Ruminococcus sp.]
MGFIELLLIGVGLSMDAFAVSVCKGLNMRKINYKHAFIIAAFFGGFQALMPFLGWALGSQFEQYIESVDHWIAFILLAFIGGKMVMEAIKGGDDEDDDEKEVCPDKLDIKELFMLAVATSIDALAVGVTFAFLNVNIVFSITTIGITTFVISIAGVVIGNLFGAKYKSKAEIAGGIILVLIGLKILLEGVGILK